MNERFVAVNTITWSRIRARSSQPRRDFSVTRVWQQVFQVFRLFLTCSRTVDITFFSFSYTYS